VNTSVIASAAPSAAKPACVQKPTLGTSVITVTAPSPAPPDTPMTPGSASGFRATAWMTAPASASAAPASTAATTLGIRFDITLLTIGPAWFDTQLTTSPISSFVSPSSTEPMTEPTVSTTSTTMTNRNRAGVTPPRAPAAGGSVVAPDTRMFLASTTRNTTPRMVVTTPVGTSSAPCEPIAARSSTSAPISSATPVSADTGTSAAWRCRPGIAFASNRISAGAARPTNPIGPASVTAVADSRTPSTIAATLIRPTWTPSVRAWSSPR
jgi:hypothetical protein